MKAKRKPAAKAGRPQNAPHAPTPEFYRKLRQAYRDQEGDMGDLLTEITARASIGERKGEAIFTAHHLRDMIHDFRQNWYDQHKAAEGTAS